MSSIFSSPKTKIIAPPPPSDADDEAEKNVKKRRKSFTALLQRSGSQGFSSLKASGLGGIPRR